MSTPNYLHITTSPETMENPPLPPPPLSSLPPLPPSATTEVPSPRTMDASQMANRKGKGPLSENPVFQIFERDQWSRILEFFRYLEATQTQLTVEQLYNDVGRLGVWDLSHEGFNLAKVAFLWHPDKIQGHLEKTAQKRAWYLEQGQLEMAEKFRVEGHEATDLLVHSNHIFDRESGTVSKQSGALLMVLF
jgi:hypothetical protein